MRFLLALSARAGVAITSGWAAYLLRLLVAAAVRRREAPAPASDLGGALLLVPAHDEQDGLPATLESLLALDGLPSAAAIVVVADNCTDATATVAAAHGVTVLERSDPDAPGKGQALAWALDQVLAAEPPPRFVVMVDADCTLDRGALRSLAGALGTGSPAAQLAYVVANADAGPSAALRSAAFLLVNVVRPAGKAALGRSAGLLGTGMAFTTETLRAVPWRAFGIVEDAEYHLRLVQSGRRVAFVEGDRVRSPMPTTFSGSRSQQLRWEGGRVALARRWVRPLVREGLARRDAGRLHAAAELCVPPLSVQVMGQGAVLGLALAARDRRAGVAAGAGLLATVAYVLGGLAYARAPRAVWVGLLHAPRLIAQKAALVAGLARGGTPADWERTERP